MTDISVSGNSPPSVSVSGSTVSVSVSSGVGPQGPAGKDGAGGVATLNGLTGTLTIASAGGVTASGTTLTIGGGGGASSWDELTGKPDLVYSVAGRTGTVTLTTTDISGFSTAASSAAPVQSVAGRTGAVTLSTADVSGYQSPPVTSVAGRTGDVTLSTSDVTGFAAAAASAAPVQSVAGRTGAVTLSTSDVSGYVAPPVSSVAGATGTVTFTAIGLATSQLGSAVTLDASPVYATPAAISASQNNYAPGFGDILRLSSSNTSTLNITGFSTSSMSNQALLINVSTHTSSVLAIKHSSSSSVSTNQVLVPWAGDCLLPPNGGAAVVIRDATSSVWRIV